MRPHTPLSFLLLSLCACEVEMAPRQGQDTGSFGAIVYHEACQRVSYSADLAARRLDPTRPLDVSGVSARATCAPASPAPLPQGADPALAAIYERRQPLIGAVDEALPEALLPSLDGYLRALAPLQDDGTVGTLLQKSGALLQRFGQEAALATALDRLSYLEGMRPRSTAGVAVRGAAVAPGLDEFLGRSLGLLVPGGAANPELKVLLTAGAFELRHLSAEKTDDPDSPERSAALLRSLLLRSHPELASVPSRPLPLALRDSRGLPLLTQISAPYSKDPQRPLASANARNRFTDAAGAEIPYVPPLAPLDPALDPVAARRDEEGRLPLYQYADLQGSLLLGALRDAPLLLRADRPGKATAGEDPARRYSVNIPFGLLRGAVPLLGGRAQLTREKEGEKLGYSGFQAQGSLVLDLLHAGLGLSRYPDSQDLLDALGAGAALLGDGAAEGRLGRALQALLDAGDEIRKPEHDALKLRDKNTLFDDLAPILARIVAVPGLLEDLVDAMADPRVRSLGQKSAQLMDERGYFFMRQPQSAEEEVNGLTPTGVLGEFGNPVDRSQPDRDAELRWYSGARDTSKPVTNDPRNNRSVLARMLEVLAVTNGGKPLCNGALADFGLVFDKPCDMFRVDNIARFFLLSVASPALRESEATFAKQSASFLAAIQNGNECRQNPQGDKCRFLLKNIVDGERGDTVLSGLMGFRYDSQDKSNNFGRYPAPSAAGRILFMDLGDAAQKPPFTPQQPRDLLFNHVRAADGSLQVDAADPDNRKFCDQPGPACQFIERYNGVLFALEKGGFYDALRPLVDAFAKHAECFDAGCTRGQNAVQILADAMTVLHRHWPTEQSGTFGRPFQDSYGPTVSPDGAARYEAVAARIFRGDLLPALSELSPVLKALTVDGQPAGKKALPVFARVLRFLADPSKSPAGLAYRDDPQRRATRNDGKPAYDDATLTQVLGKSYAGTPTVLFMAAEALGQALTALDRAENKAAKERLRAALFDAADQFLQTDRQTSLLRNRRLRPMGILLTQFLQERVRAKQADLPGWGQQLFTDLQDALTGPLVAGLVDLGVKLDGDDAARRAMYVLLQQLLGDEANLRAMAVVAADAVQLLLADQDLAPAGRALAAALDPADGPTETALVLAKRGRDYEQQSTLVKPEHRPVLAQILKGLFTAGASGIYPLYPIADAIGEVHRQGRGPWAAGDYQALLQGLGGFFVDQQRGLPRFIEIVRKRCQTSPDGTSGCAP